ncbi:polysaccharide export protein [Phormidesmis priestleyi ULC007]|uniref:Polysaccharide export protein n=1 Tax=Phormidesmis priestleyi ULC007 TaxID=1920490 RepID=A0A2T1DIQ1_9CYAN|nr:polysaccharide biosynthesis/export family protein [Phormidesmis priestleyi]PSB20389.1 polysaccharide export protein [Phormidesmis priestleyi ULC007]PZO52966.1 MAG: polysaccharide export protein [Phormidesmis priestleyi]
MNNTIFRHLHSPIVDAQALLRILPFSCLLWGLSATSFTLSAVSQEQSENKPIEITAPDYLRTSDLLRKLRQEFGDRTDSNPSEQAEFSTYRLGPGDAISANVSPRGKDYNFNATLDWAGNISVPLIGVLSLKDLTLEQAQEKIRTSLAEYLVNPQVGLVLASTRPVKVMVTGEVVKPGFYPLQDPRLPAALIEAGGTTRLADLRTVQVRRRSGNKSSQEQQIDLYTPLLKGSELPDLRLVDGDVVAISALAPEKANEYDRNLIAGVNVAQKEITIRVLDYSSGVNRVRLPNGSDFVDALTSIKPNLKDTNLKKVSLVRFDQAQGRAIEIKINARDALKGDSSQNPILENNDVIVINRNLISKINYFLNQVTQPFKDTLGFLLFFDTASNGVNKVFGSEKEDR